MEKSTHLDKSRHVNYFLQFLQAMPYQLTSLDTNRMMIVYFSVSALDLLGALHLVDKQPVIDWILQQQVLPQSGRSICTGFIGGGHLGPMDKTQYPHSHISMTYTALLSLSILGHGFEGVDKKAVIDGLKMLQEDNGCFKAVVYGSESDVRFVYCAAAISFMLQDWSGIDCAKASKFILSSWSFDGGIGLQPGLEGHGGSTYCGIAALKLMGYLDDLNRDETINFLVRRQIGGFNGRVNKVADTCYSFWVGASLQILGMVEAIDRDSTRSFLCKCQNLAMGGFGKWPESLPDPLHAYYGICGLSLINEPGVPSLEGTLGMSVESLRRAPFFGGLDSKGHAVDLPAVSSFK